MSAFHPLHKDSACSGISCLRSDGATSPASVHAESFFNFFTVVLSLSSLMLCNTHTHTHTHTHAPQGERGATNSGVAGLEFVDGHLGRILFVFPHFYFDHKFESVKFVEFVSCSLTFISTTNLSLGRRIQTTDYYWYEALLIEWKAQLMRISASCSESTSAFSIC